MSGLGRLARLAAGAVRALCAVRCARADIEVCRASSEAAAVGISQAEKELERLGELVSDDVIDGGLRYEESPK